MAVIIESWNDLALGDIVTLKSGGPDMVVGGFEQPEPHMTAPVNPLPQGAHTIEHEPAVRCFWFNDAGQYQSVAFPYRVLAVGEKAAPAAPESTPANNAQTSGL